MIDLFAYASLTQHGVLPVADVQVPVIDYPSFGDDVPNPPPKPS